MGLAEQQRALALIYTDSAWRESFWADAARHGAALGLCPAEIEELLSRRGELEYFAATLRQKRLLDARKYLPRSAALLGPELDRSFQAYALRPIPSGPGRHARDALAFLAWLGPRQRQAPRALRDAIGFDSACLQTLLQPQGILFRSFRTPVWAPDASTHVPLTLCLWLRLSPNRPWWHLRLPLSL